MVFEGLIEDTHIFVDKQSAHLECYWKVNANYGQVLMDSFSYDIFVGVMVCDSRVSERLLLARRCPKLDLIGKLLEHLLGPLLCQEE